MNYCFEQIVKNQKWKNKNRSQWWCFLALVWYPELGFIFQSGSLSFLSPTACCWGWPACCNQNLLISLKNLKRLAPDPEKYWWKKHCLLVRMANQLQLQSPDFLKNQKRLAPEKNEEKNTTCCWGWPARCNNNLVISFNKVYYLLNSANKQTNQTKHRLLMKMGGQLKPQSF